MTGAKNKNIKKFAENEFVKSSDYSGLKLSILILKITYWVVVAGAIMACLTMLLGSFFIMMDYADYQTADGQALYNECRGYFYTMLLAIFSLVSTFFLLKLKFCIPLGLISCVDCILIFTTFYGVSNRNEFMTGPSSKFWFMAIPSILVALVGLALAVLVFIRKRIVSKKYDYIVHNLYKSYSQNGEATVSPEDFEVILNEYKGEEIFPTDKPLKKSQRRRKEKQENSK